MSTGEILSEKYYHSILRHLKCSSSPSFPALRLLKIVSSLHNEPALETMKIVCYNLSIRNSRVIDTVLQVPIIPLFIKLSAEYSPMQALAVCCLSNIAAGTTAHTREVVNNEAVPMLVPLLMPSNTGIIRCLATYALGNIAAGDGVCRLEIFLANGIIPLITALGDRDDPRLFMTVNWTLLNIFRKKVPSEANDWVRALIVIFLKPLILDSLSPNDDLEGRLEDDKTVANTSLQMLLCFLHTPYFYGSIDTDPYQHVPKYLSSNHLDLTFRALEIIKHVPDNFKEVLIANQVLTKLKLLIEADDPSILLREVFEAILTFTVGQPDYSQVVIGEENLIRLVLYFMNDNDKSDSAIKLAAAKIIFNVTSGGLEQTMLLPFKMCIEELCNLFLDNNDVELLELSLGAIQNFLLDKQTDDIIKTIADLIDDCDGAVDRLNALKTMDDSNICELAEEILDKLNLE